MSMWLRQSTASQEVLLGRFVDATDGDTEETALTINASDIKVWKEGATTLASKNSGGATHIANGMYYAVLDATDTDTLGKLEIHVHATGALTVKREYMVLPAMIYDSLVLGTDRFDVNVTHVADTSQTAKDIGAAVPAATAGAAGGLFIAGSNAATTVSALTVTNATTLSGAVSLGSTLGVTGATTLTGAVSLGSTLGVTGATTFTGAVTATSASNDIRGVKLHSAGLDSVSTTQPVAERPADFREWLMWLCRRFGNKHIVNQTLGTVVVRNDADNANLSSQPYTETSTIQTVDPLT